VKPLLLVTNNEEKLSVKDQELKSVADHLDRLKLDHDNLEKTHKQMADEKLLIAGQLQAEQELSAEAEEVSNR